MMLLYGYLGFRFHLLVVFLVAGARIAVIA